MIEEENKIKWREGGKEGREEDVDKGKIIRKRHTLRICTCHDGCCLILFI